MPLTQPVIYLLYEEAPYPVGDERDLAALLLSALDDVMWNAGLHVRHCALRTDVKVCLHMCRVLSRCVQLVDQRAAALRVGSCLDGTNTVDDLVQLHIKVIAESEVVRDAVEAWSNVRTVLTNNETND